MNNVAPIKTEIEHAGQRYVDEPIFVAPRSETVISHSVKTAFGSYRPRDRILTGYQMVRLNWLKP